MLSGNRVYGMIWKLWSYQGMNQYPERERSGNEIKWGECSVLKKNVEEILIGVQADEKTCLSEFLWYCCCICAAFLSFFPFDIIEVTRVRRNLSNHLERECELRIYYLK